LKSLALRNFESFARKRKKPSFGKIMKIIAFDIGKTKILAAVLKVGRSGHKFLEIEEQKNPRNQKKIEKIMLDFCRSARAKYWTKKVAISAAHLVDPEKKIVSQGKICYGADNFSFQFMEEAGFSLKIENDGRCFALGEYFFGKGQKAKNIFAMTLGTEIGGGLLIGGKNYRGNHNSSLEISHISANYLGQWLDWVGLCAGKGIENTYRRGTGRKIRAKEIFLAATKGDENAKETISKAADILGMGTASLINILDPELIVFGGSLSKQKKFIDQAIKVAKKNIFNKKANYKFAISSLGNKANLLGAASLYF
jgi:predicted NBD/HSP70 family sugar kinase